MCNRSSTAFDGEAGCATFSFTGYIASRAEMPSGPTCLNFMQPIWKTAALEILVKRKYCSKNTVTPHATFDCQSSEVDESVDR